MTKRALIDLLTRAGWTALQALIGVAIVATQSDLPDQAWWVAAVAAGLSAAKSFVASKVGDPQTVTFANEPEA